MGAGENEVSASRGILAHNLRAHRQRLGISQEQLAALSGLHRNYVGSVERGERNISIDNIEKLAKAIGTTVPGLLSASGRKRR